VAGIALHAQIGGLSAIARRCFAFPVFRGKVAISISWRNNSRVGAAESCVPICRAAAAVAGW